MSTIAPLFYLVFRPAAVQLKLWLIPCLQFQFKICGARLLDRYITKQNLQSDFDSSCEAVA
jgi:hypothetical protein